MKNLFCDKDALVEKTITINGEEEKVWVRVISQYQLQSFVDDANSPDREKRITAGNKQLALAICDEEGNPLFTAIEAKNLTGVAFKELIRVFTEVNKSDEDNLKNS